MCGVYKITNKVNGHSYIGISSDIEKRFAEHKTKPFSSSRKDDLNKVLYRAIRKYGVDNFDFEVLEECPKDNIKFLKEREIYWIKYYNTYEDREHYNETPGGDLPGYNTVHLGEQHGMAKLTEKDVRFCRECYAKGLRSRDIHNSFFKDKISWDGFETMWHGQTWKHVMPEVFQVKPHRGSYTEKDRDIIIERFKASGLSLRAFCKTKECYVGYGTLHKMINNPDFYNNK